MLASASSSASAESKEPALVSHSYQELLDKDPKFTKYLLHIFSLQNRGIIDPRTILLNLVDMYLEASSSASTLWGAFRDHKLLAGKIKFTLSNMADASIEESILGLLEENTAEFKEEGDFIKMFNAFFAVFPQYFLKLKTEKMQKKFKSVNQDETVFKTIVEPHAASLVQAETAELSKEDVELLVITSQVKTAIQYILKNLKSKSDKYQTFFNSLILLAPHVSQEQAESELLLFTLNLITDANTTSQGYAIFRSIMHLINREKIIQRIVPILGNAPRVASSCETFSVAAKNLDKQSNNTCILPLILEFIDEEMSGPQEVLQGFQALLHFIDFATPSIFIPRIIPRLFQYLHQDNVDETLNPILITLFAKLKLILKNDGELEKQFKDEINKINLKLQQRVNTALKELTNPNLEIRKKSMQMLLDHLPIIDVKTLEDIFLPQVIAMVSQDDSKEPGYRFLLSKLVDISEEILPASIKQQIFLILWYYQAAFSVNLDILLNYFKFSSKEVLKQIVDELKKDLNLNAESSIGNDIILKALVAALGAHDPGCYQLTLVTELMKIVNFNHSNSETEKHRQFYQLLQQLPPVILNKSGVLPFIFEKIALLGYKPPLQYLDNLLNKTTYEIRAYCRNCLIQNLNTNSDKNYLMHVLMKIHEINKRSLKQFEKPRLMPPQIK